MVEQLQVSDHPISTVTSVMGHVSVDLTMQLSFVDMSTELVQYRSDFVEIVLVRDRDRNKD